MRAPFCELGAALKRRVSGSAGADERRGGAKARIAGLVRIHIAHAWHVRSSRHGSICGGSTTRGGDQAHAHMVHSPRAVPCSAPVVLGFPPSAVHILFRARPAVQSAYDANSTFVIRPDALAGFAAALLVPQYVAGARGVEDEKRSFPVQLIVTTCAPIRSRWWLLLI